MNKNLIIMMKTIKNKINITILWFSQIFKFDIFYLILFIIAVTLSILFIRSGRNTFFMSGITIELLLFYSIANFIFALVTFSFFSLFFINIKYAAIRNQMAFFFFVFFFSNEVILALIVYDKLVFLGIHVPLGACPWSYIRLTFTMIFLSTFLTLSLSFNSLSRYLDVKFNNKNKTILRFKKIMLVLGIISALLLIYFYKSFIILLILIKLLLLYLSYLFINFK
jgi:hypothetical protein